MDRNLEHATFDVTDTSGEVKHRKACSQREGEETVHSDIWISKHRNFHVIK
jgi:hypothetical protein